MNAELMEFQTVRDLKAVAKTEVMDALGKALLADQHGIDSEKEWSKVEEKGVHGVEGECAQTLVALADAYVAAHPAEFEPYASMSLEECIKALDVFRASGMNEFVVRVQVWLEHRFEKQHIGGVAKARIRLPGGKS